LYCRIIIFIDHRLIFLLFILLLLFIYKYLTYLSHYIHLEREYHLFANCSTTYIGVTTTILLPSLTRKYIKRARAFHHTLRAPPHDRRRFPSLQFIASKGGYNKYYDARVHNIHYSFRVRRNCPVRGVMTEF